MRKLSVFIMVMSLWAVSFGAGTTDVALKKIGYVKDKTYLNEYFNLSMKVAPDAIIQDEETKKAVRDMGEAAVVESNEKLKAAIAATKQKSFYLLYVSKYELGAAVNFNPSLLCVAEDVSAFKGIKTGADYLFNAKKLLIAANMGYKVSDKMPLKNINGMNLSIMNASIDNGVVAVKQDYYATVINKYAVSFILSYTNNEEKLYLEKMLNSLKNIK